MEKSRLCESCSIVPNALLEVLLVGAEGGDLYDLPVREVEVHDPEALADGPAVPEKVLNLARACAGGDVEVLGTAAQKHVAHGTAHDICLVPGVPQPSYGPQTVTVYLAVVYVVLLGGIDLGDNTPCSLVICLVSRKHRLVPIKKKAQRNISASCASRCRADSNR